MCVQPVIALLDLPNIFKYSRLNSYFQYQLLMYFGILDPKVMIKLFDNAKLMSAKCH